MKPTRLRDKISPYVESTLAYFQYLFLIYSISVPWPVLWSTLFEYFKFFSLQLTDTSVFEGTGSSNLALDPRIHFILITIMIPLFLSFVMLIFSKPIYVIAWFFVLLFGVGVFVAGVVVILLRVVTNGTAMLWAGGVCVGVCFLFYGVWWLYNRYSKEKKAALLMQNVPPTPSPSLPNIAISQTNVATNSPAPKKKKRNNISELAEKQEENEAFDNAANYKAAHSKRKGFFFMFSRWSTILIFAGMAAIAFGLLKLFDVEEVNPIYSVGFIVGPIMLGIAFLILVYVLVCTTQRGREIVETVKIKLEKHFIWIMLSVLTTLYIPFNVTALGALRCVDVVCSAGTQPPLPSQLSLSSSYMYHALEQSCQECSFHNCSATLSQSLCPDSSTSRLEIDLNQPCASNLYWFIPVSVIMGLCITLGVPLLFHRLIVRHTRLLEHIDADGEDEVDKWEQRVATTQNSAKPLYLGFVHKWRFYKMLLLLERLAVTIFTIYLFKSPTILAIITIVIHSFFCGFGIFARPYKSYSVRGFVVGTGIGLTISSILALLFSTGVFPSSTDSVSIGVAAAVLALDVLTPPILAIVFKMFDRNTKVAPLVVQPLENSSTKDKKTGEDLIAIDYVINDFTLKTMSNFFIIVGILAFLSFAAAIVGILYGTANSGVVTLTADTTQLEYTFAGYSSWDNFVENCCCIEHKTDTTSVEMWKCVNGKFKERKRIANGHSGLGIRGYCSSTFSSDVCNYPNSNNDFSVELCSSAPTIDDYILKNLW